jgi:hypothetical protein
VISISWSYKLSTRRAASDGTDHLIESRDGLLRVILAGQRPQPRRYAAPFGASRLDRAAAQELRLWDAVNDKMSASTYRSYSSSGGTHFIVDKLDRNQRRTLCYTNYLLRSASENSTKLANTACSQLPLRSRQQIIRATAWRKRSVVRSGVPDEIGMATIGNRIKK